MISYHHEHYDNISTDDSQQQFLTKYTVDLPSAIVSLAHGVDNAPLPNDYEPTEFDVVCGRGKGSYNRKGNKRFRQIVKRFIPEYTAAKTKFEKSTVLGNIIDVTRAQNNGQTRFVKLDEDGNYYELSDDATREKTGHTIREAIAAERKNTKRKELKKTVVDNKHNDLLYNQRTFFNDMVETRDEATPRVYYHHEPVRHVPQPPVYEYQYAFPYTEDVMEFPDLQNDFNYEF